MALPHPALQPQQPVQLPQQLAKPGQAQQPSEPPRASSAGRRAAEGVTVTMTGAGTAPGLPAPQVAGTRVGKARSKRGRAEGTSPDSAEFAAAGVALREQAAPAARTGTAREGARQPQQFEPWVVEAGRAEGTHQLERLTREAALELEVGLEQCLLSAGGRAPLPAQSLALVGERSAPPEAAAAATAAAAPAAGAQAAIAAPLAAGADGGADEASHALSAERGERAAGAADGGASAAGREELELFLSAGVPMRYQSPLHALKTYRLTRPARTGAEPHSFLVSVPAGAVAEPLSGAGATHTLRPEVPLCRYDLLGTCNVQGCTQQHSHSYLVSVPALCDVQVWLS
ncbi:hypothetical protein T492DRAFT_86693 [Pavlovales sp. CCMP2436]|nr:hypothetical protein T492DRAFT_86693 [Pavlovales sp. CCMP2436]